MDADGFFYFTTRLKRMIKSSGFNVYPAQVEAVLLEHPLVADVCVFGVPDPAQVERLVAEFPISLGGPRDRIPAGKLKIVNEVKNPDFMYDPTLIHGAKPHYTKVKIAPGPNNPVGVTWVDIDKEHYGIHGTPEPSKIGHTESHGCVRLTNWDAAKLSALVGPGTPIIFK